MASPKSAADVLAMIDVPIEKDAVQIGVKGMKWGVRRSRKERAAARLQRGEVVDKETGETKPAVRNTKTMNYTKVSDDRMKKEIALAVAKEFSTDALSNEQMQQVVTRMKLEQEFAKMAPDTRSTGRQFIDAMLKDEMSNRAQGKPGGLTKNAELAVKVGKVILDASTKKKG